LTVLRELVASAVGLDETRGDVLTLKSLPFELPTAQGSYAEAGMLANMGPIDLMSAIQLGVLALVALVLGLFVIRPMFAGQPRAAALPAPQPQLSLPGLEGGSSFQGDQRVLTGEIDDGAELPDLSVVSDLDLDSEPTDPASRLRRLIEERQAESLEILRGWMEHQEERV
jgi:flagellar M-ring protein FliF